MAQPDSIRPRVFVDADVLFAGSASPTEHGASLLLLRLGEITLIEAITSQQVITEVERNLVQKMPTALPAFRLLVSRALQVRPNPTVIEVEAMKGCADVKDLPILVAAVCEDCPWLVTFNGRHFQPGHAQVTVLTPGDFIRRVRYLLAGLR
jgi:predicted nucleic acid-binding protein